MIKCLPEEVRLKLRSGVAIPSFQQCVEELALNSIDAGATCVGVRMDLEAFKVQVIDNGVGMNAEDMACVGNRYFTSKCNSLGDLENLRFYGFRGEAIASIVSLATLVEVSSRARNTGRTLVRIFKDGKAMEVFEKDTPRPTAGTTVVICNFFHNMPVRRKRMDPILEGERIRHRVEAISLMHPSVSFTLKNDCTGVMLVQLPKARDTYHRFIQIHTLARAQKLVEIQYTHAQFEVTGYLGREGHYNNSLQFLYVNDRLLLKTRIHKVLNSLLRRVSSPTQKNDSPDKLSAIRSPKQKRSQDLHGIYIINIKCIYSEYDISLEPAKTLIEFKDWDGVLLCIEEAVKVFLRRENLVLSQDDLHDASPRLLKAESAEREDDRGDQNVHAASSCTAVMTLASESVHRKPNIGVCQESAQVDAEEEMAGSERCFHDHTTLVMTREDAEKQMKSSHISSPESINSCASVNQTPLDSNSINQVDCQDAAGEERAHTANKKIRLSCPFIHKCLQQPPLSTRKVFVQPHSKHKISLDAGNRGSLEETHRISAPAVCLKISKVASKESGSLDKFRRIYGKSAEPKVPSVDTPTHIGQLQTNLVVHHHKLRLQNDVKDAQEGEDGSTTTHSGFTKLKDISGQTNVKQSLASKLSHLKQHEKEDAKVPSSCVSQDNSSLISNEGLQDTNNNVCETAPVVEPSEEWPTTTNTDWLHHYDACKGKTVYVNKVTGLSRYEEPPMEEAQARCTSDVTNMAVSVVSETGVEYKCYPFQAELVLPFLPKSRGERVLSSATDVAADNVDTCDSLSSLYSNWNNPVFVRPPEVGVDISSGQAGGLAVKIHNILFPYRFSKTMIHSMKVINQVDNKFLACIINTRDDTDSEGNLLVMLDQHAAHERVRLENLIADSFEEDPNAPGERRLCSSTILPPLHICVTEEEQRLLRSCQAHLRRLGLEVAFSQSGDSQVLVGKVPVCFLEKENNELRRKRPSVIKRVVEDYLEEQMELLRSTGRVRGTLPLTVLKVLASLACHGAIKFNNRLNRDECHSLVASLSSCQLPFQCAHGRPSIAPLVDILHLDPNQNELQKPNLGKLRRMYKAWELYGKR
ncbi:DNA mismatch repair protein Mlh3 isoform X2 [Dunckerocampus dactyliophorus]|uniref:DNA mismatch repair protein Mlh3 isoform X2 n=1 Tax=Dunckerocampus dactyliophorus TaxID=161453 RepID=UPI00240693A9|nr:DNA mismatch repair protein Mlh3 isoform X2 [Dunckerocampus dactyliophorus]